MNIRELRKEISNFNKKSESLIINNNIIEDKPIKNYRGNQFDLEKFQNTMSYMEYVKNNSKNKKVFVNQKTYFVHDNITDLSNKLDEISFKKKWGRLDNYSMKNRINEYLERIVELGEINPFEKEYIQKKLEKLALEKKLNKVSELVYDDKEGKISNIPILKTLI
jgi:hypothetical protein